MSRIKVKSRALELALGILFVAKIALNAPAVTLTNPIVFVTQPQIPREINGAVTNSFLSVVTLFGNQLADTAHAARGGDLWLMTKNGGLVNLTRKAGFGTTGVQHGIGIDVRDPAIHWSGNKVLFSMVVGSPTNASDATQFFWQLYELTNLDAVISNTNTVPRIVAVPNQPANYNNVTPTYATDGRIIFMSDRPYKNQTWLYPQRDEYKSAPTITGTYSLDPTTGDLRLLQHLPSGAFNPFIDSFGRLVVTRWDHLIRDNNATTDRLGKSNNGAFNFASEDPDAAQLPQQGEIFPEPSDSDRTVGAAQNVNVNSFNMFLPWALDEDGGNEEILNHVGRHELSSAVPISFTNDPNLIPASYTNRAAVGILSANTNYFNGFFQMVEDPRTNGLYWGLDCQDISIFGGTHTSGQILTLTGGPTVNPTNMVVNYITPKAGANGPNSGGLFRNPLPMSDGSLIAVYTATSTAKNFGYDTNVGTVTAPLSMYNFRLTTMTKNGTFWTPAQNLTAGLSNPAIYYDGATLVTNSGTLWELQPVEVRARPIPAPVKTPVAPIEQQVFADEGIDLPTFQADLAQRGLALLVSRNMTARDAADKQQPYNLAVPNGVQTLGTNKGTVYNITHLQFLEADYLRGYTLGTPNVQPGRRVLATPMGATANLNYASTDTNAPVGGTQIMSDGSQATIVPAGRALTWHLTGPTNESVVKERYWLTFRPGEVRTCANCHGINAVDQAGRSAPTNKPIALQQLLRVWKTNAASAHNVTVNNGSGGGTFGAGTAITLTANPAPSGKVFSGWSGAPVSSPASPSTQLIVPTNDVTVVAVYADLPSPTIDESSVKFDGATLSLNIQALELQTWILQSSTDLIAWQNIWTNTALVNGALQFTNAVNSQTPQTFFRIRSP